MLSHIERLIVLKGADLFAATPEEGLAEIADLLIEEDYASGATIFSKHDVGTCMYLIVEGDVLIGYLPPYSWVGVGKQATQWLEEINRAQFAHNCGS
ncbi:MAG: hypothetical protein SH847_12955 [Roseiflexaceae bacterium]|nr:hypothetical protein [Roseiflexaceae bacterium]